MQVSSLSPAPGEVDPLNASGNTTDGGTGDTGFAALLAQLLSPAKGKTADSKDALAEDVAGAAATEESTPADPTDQSDPTDPTDPAPPTDPSQIAAALALATAAALPITVPPTPTVSPTTDSTVGTATTAQTVATVPEAVADTASPATAVQEAAATVIVEPPASPATLATAPKASAPLAVATPGVDADPNVPSPTLESAAEYSVLPSPSLGAPTESPAPPVASAALPKAAAASEVLAPASSASAAVAETAVAITVNDTVDPEATALIASDKKASAARAALAKDDAAVSSEPQDPPPSSAPVLEKNTLLLARNVLHENLRESSARELLASARDPEPAEKTPDNAAPSGLATTDVSQRATLRQPSASAPASIRGELPAMPSSMQTLGDDLVKHVSLNSGPGERTLTLRLVPASLGEVHVELKSTMQEVSVRLISQDPSVRQALEHHAIGLREALAQDGRETRIEIGSQLMSNMGQSHDGAWNQRQAAQQEGTDRPRWLPQPVYGAETATATTTQSESRTAAHAGVLNLFA